MFGYSVYCIEYGFPITEPYCELNERDVAEEICGVMGDATKCRWYVFDYTKGIDVYVYIGK